MINYVHAEHAWAHPGLKTKQNLSHHLSHLKLKDLGFAVTNHCCTALWHYMTGQERATQRGDKVQICDL